MHERNDRDRSTLCCSPTFLYMELTSHNTPSFFFVSRFFVVDVPLYSLASPLVLLFLLGVSRWRPLPRSRWRRWWTPLPETSRVPSRALLGKGSTTCRCAKAHVCKCIHLFGARIMSCMRSQRGGCLLLHLYSSSCLHSDYHYSISSHLSSSLHPSPLYFSILLVSFSSAGVQRRCQRQLPAGIRGRGPGALQRPSPGAVAKRPPRGSRRAPGERLMTIMLDFLKVVGSLFI